MQLPSLSIAVKRYHLRRALLFIWFPSIALSLVVTGLLLDQLGTPQPSSEMAKLPAPTGSLFAAAPPRSQVLGDSIIANRDQRVQILTNYLKSQGSPLASHAGTFITVADKYNLDWRLLPAIAGKESTFGLYIPDGSYNAWGWGIPTGATSGKGFKSWDDGIETVGWGLRHKYFNQGLDTLSEIEAVYTPPSAAQKSHPWMNGVNEFMLEIEHYQ